VIATVTLNPSLDYVVRAPRLIWGSLNRVDEASVFPGGKGLNVAIMLHRLGLETKAIGFIAGATGHAVLELIRAEGLGQDLYEVSQGMTRINVKVLGDKTTDINGPGPAIGERDMALLLAQLDALHHHDIVVLGGTLPRSLPENTYAQLIGLFWDKGLDFVVDTEGPALRAVLPARPFLIKPNVAELGQIYGSLLLGEDDIVATARRAQSDGARNVLVSRGGDGAILVTETGEAYSADVPPGRLINPVGAGDAMIAGFLAEWLASHDYAAALDFAVSVGSATAYSPWLASADASF